MADFTTSEVEGWIKDWPVEYHEKSKVERFFDAVYAVTAIGILPVGSVWVLSKLFVFLADVVVGGGIK